MVDRKINKNKNLKRARITKEINKKVEMRVRMKEGGAISKKSK